MRPTTSGTCSAKRWLASCVAPQPATTLVWGQPDARQSPWSLLCPHLPWAPLQAVAPFWPDEAAAEQLGVRVMTGQASDTDPAGCAARLQPRRPDDPGLTGLL
ncbi:hypothetical protein HaLaN_28679 [Haematococcus lacustris]|uniref:Uncharacterized protein n=1 Tax=Haematococcus lacustris TaxID=44745 RepID=A0A6A0AB84_HAELA|nr:hypothetical protein HaLaN_28679 [Haematococcus lacustris]